MLNEDGREYKKTPPTPPKQIETPKPKKENNQHSFFNILDLSINLQESKDKMEENVEELKQKLPEWYLNCKDTQDGKPEYLEQTTNGTTYKAVKVADKIYIPNKEAK